MSFLFKILQVYYYPWYGNTNFNGRNYLRHEITPRQLPTLGEYDQREPEVISQHLKWSQEANINLWATSWWGPGHHTDRNTLAIMKNKDLPGTKIALLYETTGRVKNGDVSNVYGDIDYAAKTYFNDPNYLRIDGKPVLYVYLARVLHKDGTLDDVTREMRRAAVDNGFDDMYIIGDASFGNPKGTDYEPFQLLDAVTNYDPYGSLGRPKYAGQEKVDKYRDQQEGWKRNANSAGCNFIPGVTPGYNEKGVRDGHSPMSRRLTPQSEFGSLFRALMEDAVNQVDEGTGNMVMITSWNEWHEDTQIEPVGGSGVTTTPNSRTEGVEYEAYGMRYLNILRDVTSRRRN